MGKMRFGLLSVVLFYLMAVPGSGENCDCFLKKPLRKNYDKCRESISTALEKGENIPLISDDKKFEFFLSLLNKRKEYAVKLGFVLYKASDGARREDLAVHLGRIINNNPRLILQLFIDENYSGEDMRGILLNYGDEYVDDLEKRRKETIKRLESISKIDRKELVEVKKESLNFLYKFKEKLEKKIVEQNGVNQK